MVTEKSRKKYDRHFKIDAVSMVVNGEQTVASVARDLGIDPNLLYRWKQELSNEQSEAFREGSFGTPGGGIAPSSSRARTSEGRP